MDPPNHGDSAQAPEQAAEAAISLATQETWPGRHAGAPQAGEVEVKRLILPIRLDHSIYLYILLDHISIY